MLLHIIFVSRWNSIYDLQIKDTWLCW